MTPLTEISKSPRLPFVAINIGADGLEPLEAARKLVSVMFDLDTPEDEPQDSYFMNLSMYDLGPMQISMCQAGASIFNRSTALIALTRANHFVLQFYRSGSFEMTVDGHGKAIPPDTVVLLDLLRTSTIETQRVDNLALAIPREFLEPLLADVHVVHGLVLPTDSEENAALVAHLKDLWQRLADLGSNEAIAECHSIAAMVAAVVGAKAAGRSLARAHLRKNQFSAICNWIDERIADPELGPSEIIRKFYISRPTLYRMFEPKGGIMRYIAERRLERVYRDLADASLSNEKISTIMYRYGLLDHTSAGRAFRTYFGTTPKQVRLSLSSQARLPTLLGTETFKIRRMAQLVPMLEKHNVKVGIE